MKNNELENKSEKQLESVLSKLATLELAIEDKMVELGFRMEMNSYLEDFVLPRSVEKQQAEDPFIMAVNFLVTLITRPELNPFVKTKEL